MADLSWSEATAVDQLAGAVNSIAALAAHRPHVAADLLAAVVRQLDPAGVAYLDALATVANMSQPSQA